MRDVTKTLQVNQCEHQEGAFREKSRLLQQSSSVISCMNHHFHTKHTIISLEFSVCFGPVEHRSDCLHTLMLSSTPWRAAPIRGSTALSVSTYTAFISNEHFRSQQEVFRDGGRAWSPFAAPQTNPEWPLTNTWRSEWRQHDERQQLQRLIFLKTDLFLNLPWGQFSCSVLKVKGMERMTAASSNGLLQKFFSSLPTSDSSEPPAGPRRKDAFLHKGTWRLRRPTRLT